MRLAQRSLLILLSLFFLATSSQGADLNYPYGSFRLSLPFLEDPFPGMGNYYSTLSKGMKSALWNPASLAKLKLTEATIAVPSAPGLFNYDRSFTVGESSGVLEFDPGSVGSGGNYGIFFRYPQDIGTGLATRDVDVLAHTNYATETSGLNFSSALKVNDWLSVGFSANTPINADISIAGAFPVTAKAQANFIGQKMGDMTIGTDGRMHYTYSNGSTVTYESASAIWSGFLSQEAVLPAIAFSELRNNVSFQSPYTGSVASKFGNFSVGLNVIPISANANIDNDVRAVVDASTPDIYLYTPNFDPNNQTDIQNWTLDPDRYGTANGYVRKDIRVPAGDVVGTAKYRGFYQASTTRFDLGGMYDVTDWLTVGLVLRT